MIINIPLMPGVFARGSESAKLYGLEDGQQTSGPGSEPYGYYNECGQLIGSGYLSRAQMRGVAECLEHRRLYLVPLKNGATATPYVSAATLPRLAAFLLTDSIVKGLGGERSEISHNKFKKEGVCS